MCVDIKWRARQSPHRPTRVQGFIIPAVTSNQVCVSSHSPSIVYANELPAAHSRRHSHYNILFWLPTKSPCMWEGAAQFKTIYPRFVILTEIIVLPIITVITSASCASPLKSFLQLRSLSNTHLSPTSTFQWGHMRAMWTRPLLGRV